MSKVIKIQYKQNSKTLCETCNKETQPSCINGKEHFKDIKNIFDPLVVTCRNIIKPFKISMSDYKCKCCNGTGTRSYIQ